MCRHLLALALVLALLPTSAACDDDGPSTSPAADASAASDAEGVGTSCELDEECDDADACTADSCAEGLCASVPDEGAECDDGDPCTFGDQCIGGSCAGAEESCDDGDPCTVDACVGGTCGHNPLDGCCQVSADCPLDQLCINETCVPNPNPCTGAPGTFPEGLTPLSYHDGQPAASVAEQAWTITDAELSIASTDRFEAARFELTHPARVHGFRVMYGTLPNSQKSPLVAGLYPDFGYNGFDFWQADPYWFGDVCSYFASDNEWVDFVLDEPVEIEHPGLIYVAQFTQDQGASWAFDSSSEQEDGSCGNFDDCRASLTFPTLKQGVSGGQGFYAYAGLSFPFQYDFMVELMVEFTEEITPEQTWLQPLEGSAVPGSRVSFGDYDGDGDDDIYSGAALLRNDEGSFVDVTEESGIAAMELPASGGVWGDYDNDGCPDLLVFVESASSSDSLLRNQCDGTFTNVTEAAGLTDVQSYNDCAGAGTDRAPTPAAAWWDVDADGLLDLYLANFNCWTDYSFYTDQVWRNEGDGTFAEWTGTHGFMPVGEPPTPSRGASPIDYDQDGDMDVLVNNYVLVRNLFYRGLGGGEVEEVGEDTGLAGILTHSMGQAYYGHSIGTAWGDLDGDADFDVVVANLAHPRFFDFSSKTEVLLQDGDGDFTDIQGPWTEPAGAAGLRYQETHSVPVLGDFDQDGVLDLSISCTYDGRPTDFYWGQGDGTFVLDAYHAGIFVEGGWGMAVSDIDQDGDLDLATSSQLFVNGLGADSEPAQGSWLQVRAVGNVASNRMALGATIRVEAGDQVFVRHVGGGSGQGCQNSATQHFGLGATTSVDRVLVRYIGGGEVTYEGPFESDQRLWVYEDGTVTMGWAPEPE